MQRETNLVIDAWRNTTKIVANSPTQFFGRDKEAKVFRVLRREIEKLDPNFQVIGPDSQTHFASWSIDLVCASGAHQIAVEGKFKIVSDGAVPDNRKAAFFDLFKLEKYIESGHYGVGLFLWLTDEARYQQQATGDSADFSTHEGRIYLPGTQLQANRSRNGMPLPLVLKSEVRFEWEPIDLLGHWQSIAIVIGAHPKNTDAAKS